MSTDGILGETRREAAPSHHGDLRTVTICDVEALRPHIDAWDRLASDAPQKNPYLLPGWIDAAFRHALGERDRWFCSFAYAGDRLVGVLPVIATPDPLLGPDHPILRVFDKHAQSGEALLAADLATAALRALLAEIDRQAPGHLGIDMKAVRPTSPLWDVLQGGLDGYVVRRGRHYPYSFLNVEGTFDAYLEGLGNMRRNLKRYRRRLESRGTVTVEFKKRATADDDIFAAFLELEASGWKGRNGTAIANKADSVAFYSTLIRNLAAQGHLEWHMIHVDERLVAAEIGVRFGEALFLLKCAYDEAFADCRPGNILNAEVTREAFSCPDVVEMNDMSDMEWHALWHMSRDRYVDVHLVRRSLVPILLHLPRVSLKSAYQTHLRPRIPDRARNAWRLLRRPPRKPDKTSRD